MRLSRALVLTGALSALVLLASCATTPAASDAPPGASLGSLTPGAPEREVIAQGTVIDGDEGPQLCLGGVAESYPPQCAGGVSLTGWDWQTADGAETASGVTWGAYAVQGRFDGSTLTVTQQPVSLALYDPLPMADPTGGVQGTTDDATLAVIQEQVTTALGADALGSWTENGYVWVSVPWDDGTYQRAADDDFGAGVVIVQSAFRDAG